MKQQSVFVRIIAVILTLCFIFVSSSFNVVSFAEDDLQYLSAEEKKAAIEQRLKEVNKKLEQLGEQSEETQEYIDALDEKIKYLSNELTISENEIENSKDKIVSLEKQYRNNEKEIERITRELNKLESDNKELKEKFDADYALYSQRLRAIYVSGETSVISMLLTSPDISSFLTRLEMIKRVAMNDTKLLKSISTEVLQLRDTQEKMESKQKKLDNDQKNLLATQQELKDSISDLETKQLSFQDKQRAYEEQKAESDEKLKKLHEQEDTYSEYRNQDQAELAAVNADIARAAEEFKKKLEAQQTTAAPTTTEPPTTAPTTQPSGTDDDNTPTETTTQPTTTQPTSAYNPNVLSLTYPVPSQPRITCGYGSAGYAGHTGVDFSCPTGSTVVAAESGYVIISADLMNSDGSYRSYGRYIVIMHDKTNSAGNYVYTLYAHNSTRLVSEGQYVNKGQAIAYSGSTGNSTGPHCHFEVRTPTADYGSCVDPTPYFN